MLVLAVGMCIFTAACGDSDDDRTASTKTTSAKPPAASNAASESPYCNAAREWAVYELTPFDDGDPAVFRSFWQDYLDFIDKGTRLSPPPIHDDWAVYAAAVAKQTPVMERFGYDKGRFEEQATPEEKALFESPGPEAEQALQAVLSYEALTCATGQPPAADVDFSGEEKAVEYCKAVEADKEMVDEVRRAGMSADKVRALATSRGFLDIIDKELDTAPDVIKDDVEAVGTFIKEQQLPLLARRGYDMRRILLDGPQADREILQATAPEVREHYARVAAYEEQVCGR